MTDVIFAQDELEALLAFATAMGIKSPHWQNPDWPQDRWLTLREKLAEACRQASAIQAGHEAYLARLRAADHEFERLYPQPRSQA